MYTRVNEDLRYHKICFRVVITHSAKSMIQHGGSLNHLHHIPIQRKHSVCGKSRSHSAGISLDHTQLKGVHTVQAGHSGSQFPPVKRTVTHQFNAKARYCFKVMFLVSVKEGSNSIIQDLFDPCAPAIRPPHHPKEKK